MIETERLILRPWLESDAETLYKYASDPDIGLSAGWPPHTSVGESLETIRTVFAAPEVYAVVLKETAEPVGCCGLIFDENPRTAEGKNKEAEIGYWIGKPFWGKGLTPEAARALLAHSFNRLQLSAVWCSHYEGNRKSLRVCQKCGFIYHHTLNDTLSPLGDKRTVHFYKLTASEFHAIHPY